MINDEHALTPEEIAALENDIIDIPEDKKLTKAEITAARMKFREMAADMAAKPSAPLTAEPSEKVEFTFTARRIKTAEEGKNVIEGVKPEDIETFYVGPDPDSFQPMGMLFIRPFPGATFFQALKYLIPLEFIPEPEKSTSRDWFWRDLWPF